jgi:hypothetical protein
MTKKIRKLNNDGLRIFAEFLVDNHTSLIAENKPPSQILQDDQYSEDLHVSKKIKKFKFTNRFDIGKHYFNELSQSLTDDEISQQGLWAWLCLYHWDDINQNTPKAKILRLEQYIPFGNQKNFVNNDLVTRVLGRDKTLGYKSLEYRHSIKAWYLLYEEYKNEAEILLSPQDPLRAQGDIVEQLYSRSYLSEYDVIFKTVRDIFWNNSTFVKPNGDGALADRGNKGYIGGLRRYIVVIEMLMTIYDLSIIKKSHLRKELGVEFK